MKPHILLFVIIFLASSCNEDNDPKTTCSVENPIEDLNWLAAEIEDMAKSGMAEYLYVTQAKYGFKTVFIFGNCCPNCNTIIPVYTCSGNHIGNIGSGEGDVDPSILDSDVLVWQSDNSSCYFQ